MHLSPTYVVVQILPEQLYILVDHPFSLKFHIFAEYYSSPSPFVAHLDPVLRGFLHGTIDSFLP